MIARDTLVLPGKSPSKSYHIVLEGEEIPEELQHHVTNPEAFIPKAEYEAQPVKKEQAPAKKSAPKRRVEEPVVEEAEEPLDDEPQEDDGLLPTGKKTTRKRPTSRAKK